MTYRSIRKVGRLREEMDMVPVIEKPGKEPKKPPKSKSFEELAAETLFADPDQPDISKISSLVAMKPADWRRLRVICQTFKERCDLDDPSNQVLAYTVAEAIKQAYDRHLFSAQAIKAHPAENYLESGVSEIARSKPGFERTIHVELIHKAIDSIPPDASNNMKTKLKQYPEATKRIEELLGKPNIYRPLILRDPKPS